MKKIIKSYPYKCVNKTTDNILSYKYKSNVAINIPDYVIDTRFFCKKYW